MTPAAMRALADKASLIDAALFRHDGAFASAVLRLGNPPFLKYVEARNLLRPMARALYAAAGQIEAQAKALRPLPAKTAQLQPFSG